MLWQDFLINRVLDDRALTTMLATVLPVDPKTIRVIHDTAEVLDVKDPLVQLVCETSRVTGDFLQGLQLYVLDEGQEQWIGERDDLALIGRFCEVAECLALVDDGSANPFAWLLVRGTNEVQAVLIDSKRLDQDEYVVIADLPVDAIASD